MLHFTLPSAVSNELHKIPTVDTSSARAVISYIVPSSLDLSAQQAQQAYRILAYIFSVIAVVVFVITLALRRSIATAVAVIKIGADALRSLPTLVCFPLTTVVGLGLFLVWWVFVAASLATATGGPTVGQLTADAEAGLAYLHAHAADYNISASTFAVLANASTLNATITQYTVRSCASLCVMWGDGDRVSQSNLRMCFFPTRPPYAAGFAGPERDAVPARLPLLRPAVDDAVHRWPRVHGHRGRGVRVVLRQERGALMRGVIGAKVSVAWMMGTPFECRGHVRYARVATNPTPCLSAAGRPFVRGRSVHVPSHAVPHCRLAVADAALLHGLG